MEPTQEQIRTVTCPHCKIKFDSKHHHMRVDPKYIICPWCGNIFGDYILDSGQQTCKVCGRPDKFNFTVPDKIWAEIVPHAYRCKVVCLSCFDEFAEEKDIDYSQAIKTLYFAGAKTSLKFEVGRGVGK